MLLIPTRARHLRQGGGRHPGAGKTLAGRRQQITPAARQWPGAARRRGGFPLCGLRYRAPVS